jgi:hypothetical protein
VHCVWRAALLVHRPLQRSRSTLHTVCVCALSDHLTIISVDGTTHSGAPVNVTVTSSSANVSPDCTGVQIIGDALVSATPASVSADRRSFVCRVQPLQPDNVTVLFAHQSGKLRTLLRTTLRVHPRAHLVRVRAADRNTTVFSNAITLQYALPANVDFPTRQIVSTPRHTMPGPIAAGFVWANELVYTWRRVSSAYSPESPLSLSPPAFLPPSFDRGASALLDSVQPGSSHVYEVTVSDPRVATPTQGSQMTVTTRLVYPALVRPITVQSIGGGAASATVPQACVPGRSCGIGFSLGGFDGVPNSRVSVVRVDAVTGKVCVPWLAVPVSCRTLDGPATAHEDRVPSSRRHGRCGVRCTIQEIEITVGRGNTSTVTIPWAVPSKLMPGTYQWRVRAANTNGTVSVVLDGGGLHVTSTSHGWRVSAWSSCGAVCGQVRRASLPLLLRRAAVVAALTRGCLWLWS